MHRWLLGLMLAVGIAGIIVVNLELDEVERFERILTRRIPGAISVAIDHVDGPFPVRGEGFEGPCVLADAYVFRGRFELAAEFGQTQVVPYALLVLDEKDRVLSAGYSVEPRRPRLPHRHGHPCPPVGPGA